MQNSHSMKSSKRASSAASVAVAERSAERTPGKASRPSTARAAAPTLSRLSLLLAVSGPLLSIAPGVMAAPLPSLSLNTDSTYVWPNDGSSRANQSGDWGRADAGALSGNGSQVTFSGNPVDHQTATATLNVGATLSGVGGVAVSSTATNTTTQLTLSGGNTVNGSVNGVDQLALQGHALTTLNGSAGTSAARIGAIAIGDSAGVALNGPVFAGSVRFSVPAELAVNAGLDANTIDFQNQAATIVVANHGALNGQVSSTGGANGTVVFVGSGSTTGSLGTQAAPIGAVTVGRDVRGTVTVTGDVDANAVQINHASSLTVGGNVGGSVAFSGNGTLTAGGNIGGNVSTAAAGTGNLVLNGSGSQTVSGTVGATDGLRSVSAAQTAGSSVEFDGAVTTGTVTTGLGDATFDGALNARTANLANGGSSTFNGAVAARTLNTGAGDATFNGSVNAATANLGSGNDSFAGSYNVGQTNLAAGNATFSGGSAAATNLNFTGNGSAR
ncbi:MAG: beta strand repeat-containing protein, partial [Janthinobacterium lividum]